MKFFDKRTFRVDVFLLEAESNYFPSIGREYFETMPTLSENLLKIAESQPSKGPQKSQRIVSR